MSFNNFGLSNWILKLCQKISYKIPTPIQSLVINPILKGQSVIANSQTGSGKTAAFAFPILQKLSKDPYGIFCIIITPSRQLAIQIHEQLQIFGQTLNIRQALLIGGINYNTQNDQLNSIPHFVVGTPGRIDDMLDKNEKFLEYSKKCEIMVLDEADRLFQDSLLVKMHKIIQNLPELNQIILATATIDNNFEGKRLKKLLNKQEIVFHKYSTYDKATVVPTLIQKYIFVPQTAKSGYLLTYLKQNQKAKMIIFVKTCKQCQLLHLTLKNLNFSTCLLHSFMKQSKRSANLSIFRNQKANILITTDLSSRGLDIKTVDIVVNYQIPRKVSDYIHRVGRTARKGMEGEAITFITQYEVNLFLQIQKQVGTKMTEQKINQEQGIANMKVFNRAQRQAKLQMSNNGITQELQKKQSKKKIMKQQIRQQIHNDTFN